MNRVEARVIFDDRLSKKFDGRSLDFLWRELDSAKDVFVDGSIDESKLDNVIERILADEPIQYITGRAYFYDFELNVSPATLIPRPETEELVEWIIQDSDEKVGRILDIGTGTGCIPLTLKKHLKTAVVEGVDVSVEALEIARENAEELGLEVRFFEGDVLEIGRFENTYHVIVSNPPYIPNSEKKLMSSNVLSHEPHIALFVENDDPLIFYREIAILSTKSLFADGKLYFECNEYNAKEVESMLIRNNWKDVIIRQDLQGKDRMIRATRPD